jgi:glycosyltransferase involved in cell wall biosynthesis
MRIKVSTYTRSGNIAPAGYYRIIQYLDSLENIDVKLRPMLSNMQFRYYLKFISTKKFFRYISFVFFYPIMVIRVTFFLLLDLHRCPDYVILSRVFIPKKPPFFIKFLINRVLRNSKLIWDFDDNILENKQITFSEFIYLAKMSKHIVVIHENLISLVPQEFWQKVVLLPTTDGSMFNNHDKDKIAVLRKKRFINELAIVWVATSGNLFHLERIIKCLDQCAKKVKDLNNKNLVLTVVCDKPMKVKTTHLILKNIYWTRDRATKEMKNGHIGIMPLQDSTFAIGKGGFKLIQYISIGLPVIASDVGFNKKIVNDNLGYLINDSVSFDLWEQNLLKLSNEYSLLEKMSKSAYKQWEKNFSFDSNFQVWKKLIR